jgi:hypothetical protein
MSSGVADYVYSAAILRRSLEEAADALAAADLERLLTCEARIHASLTHLASSRLSDEARARLADEIAGARHALARCRRLGAALNDFVRIGLAAQGVDEGYGPKGTGVAAERRTMRGTA